MDTIERTYTIHPKENFYFTIKIIACIILYPFFLYLLFQGMATDDLRIEAIMRLVYIYGGIILIFLFVSHGLLIGHTKGSGVKVTTKQFPEIYSILKSQVEELKMHKIPDLFILQKGGILNAFATRFMWSNYIVLYSDIVEAGYEGNMSTVEFILGHEMGHIKRGHLIKRKLLFISAIVPFLNSAYSRGCEYTCDSIGACLGPGGELNGMLTLAAGKKLYKNVNDGEFVKQIQTEDGFWTWFAEKTAYHPTLAKRVKELQGIIEGRGGSVYKNAPAKPVKEKRAGDEGDHSKYMPD